jgi:hypothetical protein
LRSESGPPTTTVVEQQIRQWLERREDFRMRQRDTGVAAGRLRVEIESKRGAFL